VTSGDPSKAGAARGIRDGSGKSLGWSVRRVPLSATAFSIAFSSWRTFPGQVCDISRSVVSRGASFGGRSSWRHTLSMK
jgi:hypothetical protein